MKQKRNLKSLCWVLIISLLALFVQACSSSMGSAGMATYSGSWGNYKCTATSKKPGGHTGVGWATDRDQAEENALDKCRAHSAHPQSCYITKCYNDS